MLTAAMLTTPTITGQGVFTAAIMAGVAEVASSIPRLISMEMIELLRPALRQRPMVAVVGIVAVIYVAVKTVRAVEPGPGSNKYTAREPVRSIVAIGGAVVGSVIKVPIRAYGRAAHPNPNGDLGRTHGNTTYQSNCESRESKGFTFGHKYSLIQLEAKRDQ
jgi:hypothetical protein